MPPRASPPPSQPCSRSCRGAHTAPVPICSLTPSSSIQSSSSNYSSSTPGDLLPWTHAYPHNPLASLPPRPPPLKPPPSFFFVTMTSQNAQRLHKTAPPDSSANSTTTAAVSETLLTRSYAWTQDQNALLFNIALEKAEFDLAHNKHKAAAEEAG